MPVDIELQLRKLPFGVLKKLELFLEPPGEKDWMALVAVMPSSRYPRSKVDLIRARGSTYGNTCTNLLLQDMCQRCVKLKELGFYLKKIENYAALEALDWPPEPVVIKTQPQCAVLPEGSELCLRVEAVGYPLPNYQWFKDDIKLVDEEMNELHIDKVTASADGKYKCIISNSVNIVCSDEVTVRIMRTEPVKGEPDPSRQDAKPVIICQPVSCPVLPGQHHSLHCQATGKQPMTYLWYKNGRPLLNTNSPTYDIPVFSEESVGSYVCQVSNASGSDVSKSAELSLERMSRPRFSPSDKVALLMGNEDYLASYYEVLQGQGTLQHAIADTRTLGSLLRREDMGFKVLSLGNLTRDEMVKGVGEYVNLLSENCYAFFYYAGHGFELNGRHYLVPVDAPADWKQEDAICIQWILELIRKRRPKMTVIILDMCRVRPGGKANFEEYDFPTELKIVFGFATCSQSESYERIDEGNGIYMKHLKNHICRDDRIENILHDVTTDVVADTSQCFFTEDQRPEYASTGGGDFSLRDPVAYHANPSAERWLQAHKLPENRLIEFENGIRVEVRFEHSDWLSNSINILVGVVDPGQYNRCNAYIYQLPHELEVHFPRQYLNLVVEPRRDINSRTMPQLPALTTAHPLAPRRCTGMFHLQRLHNNVTVTIALECENEEMKSTKYKVVVFSERDFGLAQVFGSG